MKLFSKIALATATVSIASFASAANSISGSTDFKVTLPEILVLYHWDEAHLTLKDVATTPENDNDPREISDIDARTLSANIGAPGTVYTITGDVKTDSVLTSLDTSNTLNVILENSWAVRSLSSAPVTLGLTVPNPTLTNTTVNTSTIAVKEAKLTGAGTEGTLISRTIPSGWAPVKGNIEFKIDLSAANHSGLYTSNGAATDDKDTFLLTLTGN